MNTIIGAMLLPILFIVSLVGLSQATIEDLCMKCNCFSDNKEIDCSQLHLKKPIDNEILQNISAQAIIFDRNFIVHLTPFPVMSLNKLSFKHNYIARIESCAFKNISNLTELDLSQNHLTSDLLNADIFQGYYEPEEYEPIRLTILRLSGNSLHTLHPNLFQHLPNIRELYLDSNAFKLIDHGTQIALASLQSLEVLDMSSMALTKLPDMLFHPYRSLRVVNISRNAFTSVPETLGQSNSIEELVLDQNPIESLKHFPPMPSLKILRINYIRELHIIENGSLSSLTKLEELYCSYNQNLKVIAVNAFSAKEQSPAEGTTYPPIKKLHLSDNIVGYLDYSLLSSWTKLEELNLQNNDWICDCENQWLISELYPIIEGNQLHNTAGLVCKQPSEMRGISFESLSKKNSSMRCLDTYGNHPENDAYILISALVVVLVLIPAIMLAIACYRRIYSSGPHHYSRAFYQRAGSLESFS